MPTLPNVHIAIVPNEKIVGYLLCQDHPDGRAKCRYLEGFGFDASTCDVLRDALVAHARYRVGSSAGGTMALYADSKYPVRSDIDAAHTASFASLAAPGTWGTGAQRVTVAAATRKAGLDAGVLEAPDGAAPSVDVKLPNAVLDVIGKLAVDPGNYEQADYERALAVGLSDAEYVELVGLVARMCDLDIFARGIGVPLRPLPEPQPGKPSRERPKSAVVEQAWVPTVPNLPAGGEEAKALYDGEQRPYIIRSLSLVPQEFHAHRALEGVQYSPFGKVFDYTYQHHEGLTRPQCEIVAGRISAINACFY